MSSVAESTREGREALREDKVEGGRVEMTCRFNTECRYCKKKP